MICVGHEPQVGKLSILPGTQYYVNKVSLRPPQPKEHRREDQVGEDDRDDGVDDGVGGGSADAGCAAGDG